MCENLYSTNQATMSDVIVTTGSGKVKGVTRRAKIDPYDYYAFFGIPYAEPPTGELRFRDPIAVKIWSDVRDATDHGQCCAQLEGYETGSLKGSDDCLYLNVYTRNLGNDSAKKATMVWIHGGSFLVGCGNSDWYGPEYLLRNDVVLVTINYRLGIFGFLNLDDEDAPGNQGLKDMVLALKWVKDNIANFGGDPNNVTIFGVSAGSAAIHYLTLSPLAKGLFHKAIAQSGLANANWASLVDPKSFILRLCKQLKCDSENPKEIAQFLRNTDTFKLVEAQNLIRTDEEIVAGVFPFVPSVDKKSKDSFLPKLPEELAKDGVSVPLIMGYTNKEAYIMLPTTNDPRPRELRMLGCKMEDLDKVDNNFEKYLHPRLIESMRQKYNMSPQDLKKLYFGNEKLSERTLDQWTDLNTDAFFVQSIHEFAEYQINNKSNSTFLYVMTYDGPFALVKTNQGVTLPGVCHGDDIGYLFSRSDDDYSPVEKDIKNRRVMEQMTEMWTNFAKTGNPTPNTSDLLPCKWQPITDATNLSYLNIGDQLKMESMKNIKEKYAKVESML